MQDSLTKELEFYQSIESIRFSKCASGAIDENRHETFKTKQAFEETLGARSQSLRTPGFSAHKVKDQSRQYEILTCKTYDGSVKG